MWLAACGWTSLPQIWQSFWRSRQAIRDLPVGSNLAAVGEVGLSGEIRSVSHLNQRLSEIARLGFQRCIIPAHVRDDVQKQNGLQTIPVKNIREALKAVFGA